MPPEEQEITQETGDFSPSDSFRATMDAVLKGETNQETLRRTAVEAKPKPSDDPLGSPPADENQDDEEPIKKTPAEEPELEEEQSLGVEDGSQDDQDDHGEEKKKTPGREELRKSLSDDAKAAEDAEESNLRGEMPADSARVRKRIKHYEGLISERDQVLETTKKELEQLQTKLVELEKKSGGLPEDVADQLSELRQYRRRYAIEKDPEFQTRFASKIEESNELVDDSLKAIGVTESLRNQIKQMGGIGAFVRSDVLIPVKTAKGTEKVDARTFISLALDTASKKAPDAEAVLRSEMAAQRRIEAEKSKYIEKEIKEADKYFSQLSEQEKQQSAQSEALEQELEKVITTFKANVHTNDWMKDLEVPENAPPEERKAIVADNQFRAKLRNFFDLQLQMPMVREAAKRATKQEELDEFANMLIDASRVFHVERALKAAQKQNEILQAELDKVRKASGRSTPRRTTGGRTVADTSGEPKRSDFESDLAFAVAHNRWKAANGQSPR